MTCAYLSYFFLFYWLMKEGTVLLIKIQHALLSFWLSTVPSWTSISICYVHIKSNNNTCTNHSPLLCQREQQVQTLLKYQWFQSLNSIILTLMVIWGFVYNSQIMKFEQRQKLKDVDFGFHLNPIRQVQITQLTAFFQLKFSQSVRTLIPVSQ